MIRSDGLKSKYKPICPHVLKDKFLKLKIPPPWAFFLSSVDWNCEVLITELRREGVWVRDLKHSQFPKASCRSGPVVVINPVTDGTSRQAESQKSSS